MATASDVLRIAAGEIGYSRWNDPQAGTKYGRWYAQKTGDSYYGQSGVPYCAMFVSWVFDQAKQSVPGLPGAYCPYIRRDGINAGLKVDKYKAQPGDIVLFDWGNDGVVDHVGIVEKNNGSYLTTCEGNTGSGNSGSQSNGGCVARRTRSFSTINTVLRPKYDTGVVSQDNTASGALDEDGLGGPKTISSWQTACGTYSDGIISGQVKSNKDYLGNLWSVSYDRGSGSALVLHLQKMFGLDQDGLFGPNTARKTQQYLQNSGYSVGNSGLDGIFGHDSVVALQKSLNDGGKIWKASSANPAPETPKSTVDSSKSTMVGIDVSSHDNFNGSTFKSNTESAYKQSDFVIVKATQGLSYVNPQCDGAYQRAKREGKCLGVYHYAGGNDANLEAAYFYNNVKGYIGEAIPCIDWESGSNKSWGNKNWVRTFVNKFHELSDVWCMIYVQASSISQVSDCVNDCALWVAGYPDLRNSFNTPSFHYNISPWQAYTVWQFSSSNEQTDRNVANIGPDAWKRIAKGDN